MGVMLSAQKTWAVSPALKRLEALEPVEEKTYAPPRAEAKPKEKARARKSLESLSNNSICTSTFLTETVAKQLH